MSKNSIERNSASLLQRIYLFYKEGFMSMTVGRTLWIIILIKLFVLFFILKLFFFPSFLSRFENDVERADYVATEITTPQK